MAAVDHAEGAGAVGQRGGQLGLVGEQDGGPGGRHQRRAGEHGAGLLGDDGEVEHRTAAPPTSSATVMRGSRCRPATGGRGPAGRPPAPRGPAPGPAWPVKNCLAPAAASSWSWSRSKFTGCSEALKGRCLSSRGSGGRPSNRSPMMLRSTSSVPPAIASPAARPGCAATGGRVLTTVVPGAGGETRRRPRAAGPRRRRPAWPRPCRRACRRWPRAGQAALADRGQPAVAGVAVGQRGDRGPAQRLPGQHLPLGGGARQRSAASRPATRSTAPGRCRRRRRRRAR